MLCFGCEKHINGEYVVEPTSVGSVNLHVACYAAKYDMSETEFQAQVAEVGKTLFGRSTQAGALPNEQDRTS